MARPLSECTWDGLSAGYALVFGKVRVRRADTEDWHWSKSTWWIASCLDPHRHPKHSGSWCVGLGNNRCSYRGDADLTHFMQLPSPPPGTEPDANAEMLRETERLLKKNWNLE